MGTNTSANDEWIELHNDGSTAVDVADWRITDGANFDVVLAGAGSIAPGAYAVLERTDESSAPGSAFFIYTGSLTNTGATLRLYDAGGNLLDQVAGGENWENIGGDNTTKETAQYTSRGWGTATPTPGAANTTATSESDQSGATESTTHTTSPSTSRASAKPSKSKTEIKPTRITIEAPAFGYVGQEISFEPVVAGGTKWSRGGQDTEWNFGDTYTSTDRRPTHQYRYPGTYVVSLVSEYEEEAVTLYHEITIVPLNLSLTQNRSGAVQVSNDAQYDVPLAGVTVAAADTTYTFPPETHLKANNTITLPPTVFAPSTNSVLAVHDQLQSVVTYRLPAAARQVASATEFAEEVQQQERAQPSAAPAHASNPTPVETPVSTSNTAPSAFSFASAPAPAPEPRILATSTLSTAAAAPNQHAAAVIDAIPAQQPSPTNSNRTTTTYAYFGLIGLLLVTTMALLSRRVRE